MSTFWRSVEEGGRGEGSKVKEEGREERREGERRREEEGDEGRREGEWKARRNPYQELFL